MIRFAILPVLVFVSCIQPCKADLMTGDMLFTGFNTNGNDDFALVALRDITNESIFFSDDELDGTGGFVDSNEGAMRWDTGLATISAGTVVVFTDITGGASASLGTLTIESGAPNLNGNGDALFAYQGANSSTPSRFIAAISNEAGNYGNLANSGLIEGVTALTITNGAHDNGGEYDGPRAGETAFSDYGTHIATLANWSTQASDGELILPFNATAFTITAIPEPSTFGLFGAICSLACFHRRRTS